MEEEEDSIFHSLPFPTIDLDSPFRNQTHSSPLPYSLPQRKLNQNNFSLPSRRPFTSFFPLHFLLLLPPPSLHLRTLPLTLFPSPIEENQRKFDQARLSNLLNPILSFPFSFI